MLDLSRVPLSTISQDVKQLGQVAAKLVVRQLKYGQEPKVLKHVLPVRMILWQSTTRKVE